MEMSFRVLKNLIISLHRDHNITELNLNSNSKIAVIAVKKALNCPISQEFSITKLQFS